MWLRGRGSPGRWWRRMSRFRWRLPLGGGLQQQPEQQHPPAETPEQEEIRRLADRIRELQMPKVPALSLGELQRLQPSAVQWARQCDVLAALWKYSAADDAEAAARAPAEAIWRVLYYECQPQQQQEMPTWEPQVQQWYAQPEDLPAQPQDPPVSQPAGLPGACIRCGRYGHWARDCDNARPQGRWQHGQQGLHLYTVRTTGRRYYAPAPPPYPCRKCG